MIASVIHMVNHIYGDISHVWYEHMQLGYEMYLWIERQSDITITWFADKNIYFWQFSIKFIVKLWKKQKSIPLSNIT